MADRPKNLWQVLAGATSTGLGTFGAAKQQEAQMRPAQIFEALDKILAAERAQQQRQLFNLQMKQHAVDLDIANLKLKETLAAQKYGDPIELQKALKALEVETEVLKVSKLMGLTKELTGFVTIPESLKIPPAPPAPPPIKTPEQQGTEAAVEEAAKKRKLQELGIKEEKKTAANVGLTPYQTLRMQMQGIVDKANIEFQGLDNKTKEKAGFDLDKKPTIKTFDDLAWAVGNMAQKADKDEKIAPYYKKFLQYVADYQALRDSALVDEYLESMASYGRNKVADWDNLTREEKQSILQRAKELGE